MSAILIKNGRVIDPVSKLDGVRDVLIENGKIKKVGVRVMGRGAKVFDAKGKLVMPGLVDLHTHLRDPGRPDKETIASGTRAAALGGFTTICCMANTEPVVDNPAVVKYVLNKAEVDGVVNVLPIAAVSKGLKLFKVALAATGVGLLVIALGSVVTFIVSCAAGADANAIFRYGLNWHKCFLSMTVRS